MLVRVHTYFAFIDRDRTFLYIASGWCPVYHSEHPLRKVGETISRMSGKRFAGSLAVAFIAATVFDIVLNGVVLRSAFEAGIAGMATLAPWPAAVLVGMGIQQAGNVLLLGLCFGGLYRVQVNPDTNPS